MREGPGVFPRRRRDETPKAQKLIFIGKTQNKQPVSPTFRLGEGELRICTLLPYIHSRIRLEKVPPVLWGLRQLYKLVHGSQAPFPLRTRFSHL